MKRLIAFITMGIILLCSFAYAEVDFDVNKYTTEELNEIYSIVSEKLKGYVVIPDGYYVVGKDLPAGKYTFLCSDLLDEDLEDGIVLIYNNAEDYKSEINSWGWMAEDTKAEYVYYTFDLSLGCELTDGMVIGITGKAAVRKAESGLFSTFWN